MKHIGLIVLLLTTTLLAACEQKPYKPPVPHTEPDKLFEPQREALDKAKGVGKTVEQASQELKEATEKATGN